MIVLLTNDDGFDSPGLKILESSLSSEHEVWTIAPDSDRSGSSHCITLRGPIKLLQKQERAFSSSGTPVDCVVLSALGALPVKPEVIISGINLGPNLGLDITFSGTTAAARQGTIMNIPSIAVSVASFHPPYYLDGSARFVKNNIEKLTELWTPDHFVNINVPNEARADFDVAVTCLSRPRYKSSLHSFSSPVGEQYFFLQGLPEKIEPGPGTDMHAVLQGSISISPIALLPVISDLSERYKPELFL